MTKFMKPSTIFSDLIEKAIEVFMDDFNIFSWGFDHCLDNIDKVLQRRVECNLTLN